MNEYVLELGKKSKDASKKLIKIDTVTKNNFFSILKNNLDKFREKIKEQNQIDIENGEKKGLTKAFLDRLLLTDSRIDGMLESIEIVRNIHGNKDPKIALPGTIRGDYANSTTKNIVHASDCLESAKREISIWFPELECIRN